MNWKISKIEISSFKAFKRINLDFGESSLLTLDGPNGFGKTSIFDAIELLLTGSIGRIRTLFASVMVGKQVNYKDNLLWNNRSGNNDLSIKIEFSNGSDRITLARHSQASNFKLKSNNRADQFSHFTLYKLPDFSSNDYSEDNRREEGIIEEIFGKNFKENFSHLHYLEQGQNQLLHTRVDKRKEALNHLFNISDAKTEIDRCRNIALRLTNFIGDPLRTEHISKLNQEASTLREMVQGQPGSINYTKLSTSDTRPGWDKEDIFPIYSKESHEDYIKSVEELRKLSTLKTSIQARDKNDAIDSYIEANSESIESLARFGVDLDRIDELEAVEKRLKDLNAYSGVIKRGAASISPDEARKLTGWPEGRLEWFLEQIPKRDSLQQKCTSNTNAATELDRLKAELLAEQAKIEPGDQHCPLCGADWQTHEGMLKQIELRSAKIKESLNSEGQALLDLLTAMSRELAQIDVQIQREREQSSAGHNSTLYRALVRERSRLPVVGQLAVRLRELGVRMEYSFSDNEDEVEARTDSLLHFIRSRKTAEPEALPSNWKSVISSAFKDLQDFYIMESQALVEKQLYISAKANEAQSIRLQQCLDELKVRQNEIRAANSAKTKINSLKELLEKAERRYSEQTIAEIELIFHIYSGRLIQNYQRGLGLFIESKDGKELRFLTAEKSQYDAILSMSTGQVSALSLGFFLSLCRVYGSVPLILIDDPSQSLDEVNIASLTDLLRCEFNSHQLIISSHEEDISSYMRYRFAKAGLITRSLNMQKLAKDALAPHPKEH